jgi:hypothetical protein
MPHPRFDRDKLRIRSLRERKNQLSVEKNLIPLSFVSSGISPRNKDLIRKTAGKILSAREKGRSVMLVFGAHTIKNGLAPFLQEFIKKGWVTHLAANGAGIIHDWEFAFQGKTGEDVRENVRNGQFGIWEETGFYINLALIVGAYEELGYGESVGKMISREGLLIPDPYVLRKEAVELMNSDPEYAAAAIDLSGVIEKNKLAAGFLDIHHPFKEFSVQCTAYDLGIPFTGHPMFGHDIIYNHPMNHGAAIGRTALSDFLAFSQSVSNLEDGVYISVGSAVMSPMVFEKALSMAQNIKIQENTHISNHYMVVADMAENNWDWIKNGEPPADNPAYYLRYCKTFSRMGGEMHYITADNRDFIPELYRCLKEADQSG